MAGRDGAHGICKSLKRGEPAAGMGLAGAVALLEHQMKGWRLNGKQPRQGTPDGGVGGARYLGENTFPGLGSYSPTKLRVILCLQPCRHSASRHTGHGKRDPCCLPPACCVGISFSGDIPDPSGHQPAQPVPRDPALAGGWTR